VTAGGLTAADGMCDMRRTGRVFAWCGHLLAWVVILGVATVVTATVVVPRIGGATPYTVLTGSMRPTMPPGTMVVARPRPADQVRVGDVVTYQLRSGEPEVVTHRVVAVGLDGGGHRIFRTQGDANDVPDADWVRPVQIKGVRWYAVPRLGRVTNLLNGSERQAALTLVVSGLLAYALFMFGSDWRERRRGRPARPPRMRIGSVHGSAGVGHG
jgi:signal peptidase